MNTLSVNKLVNKNFNAIFINALDQFWHTSKSFQCIGKPKKYNLLLYLDGCKITYTTQSGRTVTAESGDVVYTPIGSEYRAKLSDFEASNSHTVGINFFLYDESGEGIILSDDIKVFHFPKNQTVKMLFHKALRDDLPRSFTQKRILLMEILCALAGDGSERVIPDNIKRAVRYLTENIEEAPTVAELARLCNISEVYFRKQFKAYMSISPHEYRNELRLSRACTYLEYGDISVQEISDRLGYATVSHFIKEFKKRYGLPPLKYRRLGRAID